MAKNIRKYIQLIATVFQLSYAKGFRLGKVFSGGSKSFCLPVINCSSCPGSLFSCPVGMIQKSFASHSLPLYVLGMIAFTGVVFGRLSCAFLCPFGYIQDLLYKIPFIKKLKHLKGEKWLKRIRGVVFWGFVVMLPLALLDGFGYGKSWFCALLCPAGTLEAGLPLTIVNEGIRASLGFLFYWKFAILAILLVLGLMVSRPFCRYLCPMGYALGKFNRISLYQIEYKAERCIGCGKCASRCPMGIDIRQNASSEHCIRCGECVKACPVNALTSGFKLKNMTQKGVGKNDAAISDPKTE